MIRCAPVAARAVARTVTLAAAPRVPCTFSVPLAGSSTTPSGSYCTRYRVAARTSNTPDSTTGHGGFRCALSG